MKQKIKNEFESLPQYAQDQFLQDSGCESIEEYLASMRECNENIVRMTVAAMRNCSMFGEEFEEDETGEEQDLDG